MPEEFRQQPEALKATYCVVAVELGEEGGGNVEEMARRWEQKCIPMAN